MSSSGWVLALVVGTTSALGCKDKADAPTAAANGQDDAGMADGAAPGVGAASGPDAVPNDSGAEADLTPGDTRDEGASPTADDDESPEAGVGAEGGVYPAQLPPDLPSDCDDGEVICHQGLGYECDWEDAYDYVGDDYVATQLWQPAPTLQCPLLSRADCNALVAELSEIESGDNPCSSDAQCRLWGGTYEACDFYYVTPPFSFSVELPAEQEARARDLFEQLERGGCRTGWGFDSSPTLVHCAQGRCETWSESCLAQYEDPTYYEDDYYYDPPEAGMGAEGGPQDAGTQAGSAGSVGPKTDGQGTAGAPGVEAGSSD